MKTKHKHDLKHFAFVEHFKDDEVMLDEYQDASDTPYHDWAEYLVDHRHRAALILAYHFYASVDDDDELAQRERSMFSELGEGTFEELSKASWWRAKASEVHKENPHEAVGVWRYALHLEPNHPDALRGLGLSLWKAQHYSLALDSLRAAAERVDNADTWLKIGLCLKALGGEENVREAIQAVLRGAELDTTWWGYHFNAALWSRTLLQDYEGGVRYGYLSMKREARTGTVDDLTFNLVKCDRGEEALEVARQALRMKLQDAHAYEARALRALKRWDEAIVSGRKAIEQNPSSEWCKGELCVTLYYAIPEFAKDDDAFGRVRALIQEMADTRPTAQWLNNAGFRARSALVDFEWAESLYRKALEDDPKDKWSLKNLGSLLVRTKRYEEAQELLNTCAQLYPEFTSVPESLMDFYMETLRPKDAEDTGFSYCARCGENHDWIFHRLGHLYDDYGLYDEAEKAWIATLEIKPTWSKIHHDIGSLYLKQGEYTRAQESFEACLEVDETSVHGMCGLIELYTKLSDHERAREWLQRAHKEETQNVSVCRLTSEAALARGDFAEAVRWAQRAVRFGPYFDGPHAALGRALHAQGKLQAAIRSFRDALEWNCQLKPIRYNELASVLREDGQFDAANDVDLQGAQFRSKKRVLAEELRGFDGMSVQKV